MSTYNRYVFRSGKVVAEVRLERVSRGSARVLLRMLETDRTNVDIGTVQRESWGDWRATHASSTIARPQVWYRESRAAAIRILANRAVDLALQHGE